MSIVRFTPKPLWVTKTGPSPFEQTMEFRHYRSARLTLRLFGFDGATAPMLWVAMETSLYPDRDFGRLGCFDSVAKPGDVSEVNFDYLMRYVRWNVIRLQGATAACFTLEGMASD